MSSTSPEPDLPKPEINSPELDPSDPEPDFPELDLLAAYNARFNPPSPPRTPPTTGVLASAQHIATNATSVAIDMTCTKRAARTIHAPMLARNYTTATWSTHPLHPQTKDEAALDFVFTTDLLNFSFWSERPEGERFAIEYRGERWTGYWSLVAALRRAVDEGVEVTSPAWWREAGEGEVRAVFRSATDEEMPLLDERVRCLREAGEVLERVCGLLFFSWSSMPPSTTHAPVSTTRARPQRSTDSCPTIPH